jgi:ferric-dicitrate binding protein FerR (iron transport regulator)
MQTLYVPAGQRAEISLEDGTKVWLNANTKLIFPNQFSGETREVQLDGEGFFDVAPGKSKPFIVKSEKVDVKVWGTRFNLMAYSGSETFETSLLEGSVEVIKSNSSKGVMLHPNERISLVKEQLVISPISNMNHFLWKEGIISFDNESFPELVDKLELYFDIKIQVKNEKILSYKCTGKFRTKDGIEHILKVLQLRNNFSYRIDEKLNKITIK